MRRLLKLLGRKIIGEKGEDSEERDRRERSARRKGRGRGRKMEEGEGKIKDDKSRIYILKMCVKERV